MGSVAPSHIRHFADGGNTACTRRYRLSRTDEEVLKWELLKLFGHKALIELGFIPDPALGEVGDGSMQARIVALVSGVLLLVIGMVLSTVVVDQTAAVGGGEKIGSFAGTQAILNLVPLIFVTSLIMIGIAMIGIGAGGFMGRGPLAG